VQRLSFFRSRFFWKLYLAWTALFAVVTAFMIWLVTQRIQEAMTTDVVTGLQEKIALLTPWGREAFTSPGAETLEQVRARLADLGQQSNTRVTLVAPGGRVLADSHHNADRLDNHWDRPEIQAALLAPQGEITRHSATSRENMVYLARAINGDGDTLLGVIRVGIPVSRLDERLGSARAMVLVVGLLGVGLTLLVGFLLARRVSDPVNEITSVADAMRQGEYTARVRDIAPDEIGRLGDTLNRMGDEVSRSIATISQEQAQLKAMLAGMVEGIIAVDDEDRILFSNRAVDLLLRTATVSSRGRKLTDIPSLEVVAALVSGARTSGELVRDELQIGVGDSAQLIETHASPFRGEQASGVIVVLHDVTDLRRLERVRRDFVANVSHELKTPLTSIKGYVETLLSGAMSDPDTNARFLQKIDRNVDRLVALVQDILSLARIESHEEGVRAVPVEWGPVIRTVLAHHEDDFTRKGLALEFRDPGRPVVVLGDKEAMTQVVENLVNNAIKYTPQGGRIGVTLSVDDHQGTMAVSDTGIGIPRKHLDRIFERFYRVDKARSRELGGTGLGLSIVRHLVAGMNGKVGVESQVGVGSRFSVTLNLAH
jgi:two-component system phosphate regulon sensor histidine kinase PhoR